MPLYQYWQLNMRTLPLIIVTLVLFFADISIPSHWHSAQADELLQPVHPSTNPVHGVRYKLAGGSDQWDANARQRIVRSMDEAVAIYNANGNFDKLDTAAWSPGTPTADSNFGGYIRFGGAISTRVALHEIAHTLGIGTAPNWMEFNKNGIFTGKYATEMLRKFDGPSAVLHCDHMHIWPYGLNYDNEGGEQNYKRNVRMVAAIRVDLGLAPPSSLLPPKERITAARDEVAAAKSAVADAKAKVDEAARQFQDRVDSRPDVATAKKELSIIEKAEAAAVNKALNEERQTPQYIRAQTAATAADQHFHDVQRSSSDPTATNEAAIAALVAHAHLSRLESSALSSDDDVFNMREAHRAAQIALIAARAAAPADDPDYQAAKSALSLANDRLASAENELAEIETESKTPVP
jgi:hypothetical protein